MVRTLWRQTVVLFKQHVHHTLIQGDLYGMTPSGRTLCLRAVGPKLPSCSALKFNASMHLIPSSFQTLTSPVTPFFFFLTFLAFFLSRFFSPDMPALQASAYLAKNVSRSSGFTTVLKAVLGLFSLSVPSRLSLLLLDARTSTGSAFSGCVSHSGSSAILVGEGGVEAESKTSRFCVR